MRLRALPFAFALAALAFPGGGGAPPVDPVAIGPRADAIPAPEPSTAADVPDAPPAPEPPDDAPGEDGAAAEPRAYLAYVAEAERRCKPKAPQETTWGMVQDSEQYLGCHAAMIAAGMAKLPPSARAVLLDGDAASPRPTPAGGLRARTVDALCRVQAARLWDHGGTSWAGEVCHDQSAWCLEGPNLGLGFVVQAWRKGSADDAAQHIRSQAARGRQVVRALPAWKRYASLAAATAPFAAQPDPPCSVQTRLVDLSFIALGRDLALADEGTRALAAALCGAWPALADALGGPAACERAVTTYELSFAAVDDPANDPLPTQRPDRPDTDLPPPGDPDLVAEVQALRERCAEGKPRCYADLRREEAKRAALPFDDRLEPWARDLCTMPHLYDSLRIASDAYHPPLGPALTDARCDATADLLRVYALRRLSAGGAPAFGAHARRRSAWGSAVKGDVEEILRRMEAPCADRKGPCSAGSPAERADVAARMRRLLAGAPAIAAAMCDAGGLASALGGGSACAEEIERWLFSMGAERLPSP